jgi:hypothetical protein
VGRRRAQVKPSPALPALVANASFLAQPVLAAARCFHWGAVAHLRPVPLASVTLDMSPVAQVERAVSLAWAGSQAPAAEPGLAVS